jgi:hypothetical protein
LCGESGKELDMETQHTQEIKKIIKECLPGCKCHGRGIEELCKAKDIGLATFAQCLEEHPWECTHAISYGAMSYCSCPPRVKIAQRFEKAT